jgi:Retinal pigment epithelial membrane protein
VTEEITAFDLPVTGSLPAELSGRYLRNGPNPLGLDDPDYHWFLGAGMVHGVRLRGGKAEWYRNRWVRSKAVAAQHDEKWPGGPVHENMDFAANTCIIAHAGRTLATAEAGPLPYELTDELGTIGPCNFGGTLPGGFAAHTKLDRATGELHAIAYFWAWDYVQHVVVDATGKVTRTTNIPVPDGPMMHDFALTEKHVVLLDLPVTFSLNAATQGKEMPYVWNSSHQARVGLLPRDGSSPVRWIELEPCWVFHCLNAYDDEHGRVVVDLCQYSQSFDVSTLWHAHGPVTLDRWTIDPAAGKVTQQRLDDRGQEFPGSTNASSPGSTATATARRSARSPGRSPRRATSATTRSATPSLSTTWLRAPCRRTSSAATPPWARPCSPRSHPTPPKTTATSWPSLTTPTAVQPTWSSSLPRTSPPNRSPASTCPPGSRSASTATGSPTTDGQRRSVAADVRGHRRTPTRVGSHKCAPARPMSGHTGHAQAHRR